MINMAIFNNLISPGAGDSVRGLESSGLPRDLHHAPPPQSPHQDQSHTCSRAVFNWPLFSASVLRVVFSQGLARHLSSHGVQGIRGTWCFQPSVSQDMAFMRRSLVSSTSEYDR